MHYSSPAEPPTSHKIKCAMTKTTKRASSTSSGASAATCNVYDLMFVCTKRKAHLGTVYSL